MPKDSATPAKGSGGPRVGYRMIWLKLAKLCGLPPDVTPHVLRHSFASLAADLGYNEPTIASLIGHKTHSMTSRYVHCADAVLLAAFDVVADAIVKLMAVTQEPALAQSWLAEVADCTGA